MWSGRKDAPVPYHFIQILAPPGIWIVHKAGGMNYG
jgi:hypothetical protein